MRRTLPTTEQVLAASPATSAWVSANAGSGKTHVLIDRVARLLLAGADPQSILCLTFTRAAAAEMSGRLFEKLSSWIGLDDDSLMQTLTDLGDARVSRKTLTRARQLFALAIETPGGLKIQTIHAFCEKLLQLFPVEAGLAPGFRVMDEGQSRDLVAACCDAALQALASRDPEGALDLFDDGAIPDGDRLDSLAKSFLSGQADFHWLMEEQGRKVDSGATLRAMLGVSEAGSDPWANFRALSGQPALSEAIQVLAGTSPHRGQSAVEILRMLRDSDDNTLPHESLRGFFLTDKGLERKELVSKATRETHPEIFIWLITLQAAYVVAARNDALQKKITATVKLVSLMREIHARFERSKASQGLYDFDDLIGRTARLLSTSRAAQWVLNKLDAGLSHILIDEAQDTSPNQWQIISALVEEFFSGVGRHDGPPRTVFAVGDIKQSIFSFQGADTDVFRAASVHLRQGAEASNNAFAAVDLTVSYRTVPEILKIVDAVFGEEARATKGLGTGSGTIHEAKRKDDAGFFEFWPLITSEEHDEPEEWQVPVDAPSHNSHRKLLARCIAMQVKSWLGTRLLPSSGKPVQPGDVLLLFRRRGELFESTIAALRADGIPVAGADRLRLSENIAVQDLLALAQVCLLAEDDLALAAVLKSPLVPSPLDEEGVMALAVGRGTERLWPHLLGAPGQTANASYLVAQAGRAISQGPFDFLARVLNTSRKSLLARLGPEALEATDILLDLARDYEQREGHSLAGFLHWFQAREEEHKRDLDQGGGEVRLMTIHGAKGLEAPIVLLVDAADQRDPRTGSLLTLKTEEGFPLPLLNIKTDVDCPELDQWKDMAKDQSRDESKRLLYVAMTRARDELYVCGSVGNSHGKPRKLSDESWYALIEEALDRSTELAFERPDIGHPAGPVRRFGRRKEVAAASTPSMAAAIVLPEWLTRPPNSQQEQKRPSAITRLAGQDAAVANRQAVNRGLAVHRFFENWRPERPETARRLAIRLGLEEDVVARLVELAQRPDLGPLFSVNSRSEVSIRGDVAGLGFVEGQIDRLCVLPDTIWLLDYKSGSSAQQQTKDRYYKQMALYAAVLAEAFPHRTIRAALLWTHTGLLEWLDNNRLSQLVEELRTMKQEPAA